MLKIARNYLMPYYFNPADRAPMERSPGVNLRTAWLENMLLSQVELAPNVDVPPHNHPKSKSQPLCAVKSP